jgi:putative membrane protein
VGEPVILLPAGALAPHDLWRTWNLAPGVLAGLAAAGGLYAAGLARLWRAAGVGRGAPRWRAACYAGGLAVVALALVSPLDAVAEAVFWGHMVQHLLLILVAAPLLVLGAPLLPLLWLLDAPSRQRLGAWWHRRRGVTALAALLTTPLVAWGLHIVAIWAWHLPAAYQAALADGRVHVLEHLSFLGTALLFWWVVLQPAGRRRMSYGMSLLYVVTAGMQGGLLGALLTFAGKPFYPAQSAGAAAWGLTPLADQQLAGLIMWLPAGLVYMAVAGVLFVLWLRAEEVRVSRRGPAMIAASLLVAALAGGSTACRSSALSGSAAGGTTSGSPDKHTPHSFETGGDHRSTGILGEGDGPGSRNAPPEDRETEGDGRSAHSSGLPGAVPFGDAGDRASVGRPAWGSAGALDGGQHQEPRVKLPGRPRKHSTGG